MTKSTKSVDNSAKFHIADIDSVKHLAAEYNAAFTKDKIIRMLNKIRKALITTNIRYVDNNDAHISVPEYLKTVFGPNPMSSYYVMRKSSLAEAMAYFDADIRNKELLRKISSVTSVNKENSGITPVMNLIALNGVISASEINKMLGSKAVSIERDYYWRTKITLVSTLKGFRTFIRNTRYTYGTSDDNIFLRLPASKVSSAIESAYPAQPAVTDDEIRNNSRYLTVNRMNDLALCMSTAGSMLDDGTISRGASKTMTKTDMKKFIKQLPDDPVVSMVDKLFAREKELGCISLESVPLFVSLCTTTDGYSYHADTSSLYTDPAAIIKAYLNSDSSYLRNYQLLQLLLPLVSRLNENSCQKALNGNIMQQLINSMESVDDKGWWPVENIVHDAYRRLYLKNKELILNSETVWPDIHYIDNKGKQNQILPGNAVSKLTFPMIRSFIFFLTALGIVETAIDLKDSDDSETSFRSLRYIRFTPLGMYVMKNGPEVNISKENEYIYNFELIDNPMLVVSVNPSNPYNRILNQIGIRSGNRWLVTPASFLSHCTSGHDISKNIEQFKKYICKEPSQVWEDFFKRMLDNSGENSLRKDRNRYDIFTINKHNKELLNFLSTDPEVRQLIYRTENFRILVPWGNTETLRILLRNAGFLIWY